MAEVTIDALPVLRCRACGRTQLPPRAACWSCGGQEFDSGQIGVDGTVETFTVIRVPPARFRQDAPYVVLVGRLEGGVRITGRLLGSQEGLAIGTPVRLVRRDEIGYWFERGD